MPCPYLTQVTMVYCRASPVRVYVPSDKVTTSSKCEGDCYQGCPMYRDSVEAASQEIRSFESETSKAEADARAEATINPDAGTHEGAGPS